MKKKTKIIIAVVVAAVIIICSAVGIGVYTAANTAKATLAIGEEVVVLNECISEDGLTMDVDKMNEILERHVVEKGSYAVLEECVKDFYGDVFSDIAAYMNAVSNERIMNILTPENVKADGPDFKETRAYLSEAKNACEKVAVTLKNVSMQEAMDSYIEGKDLNALQTGMFYGFVQNWSTDNEELVATAEQLVDAIEIYEEAIDYLAENKNSWTVEGDSFAFKKQKNLDEYNAIVAKLQELA